MKIVCKYKDFYDYIVQDYDADIVYVRYPKRINEYYDDLFEGEGRYTPYYNKQYEYYIDNKISYVKEELGNIKLRNYIFGIYPFVFSQPYIDFRYKDNFSVEHHLIIILSKNIVDDLLNKETRHITSIELSTLIWDEINKTNIYFKKPFRLKYKNKPLNDYEGFCKDLKRYVWKVSCPEIFYKIEAPIFVKNYDELFNEGVYVNEWPEEHVGNSGITHYITNICFQKLDKNILKYWYDDVFTLNTYINIENFLWSIKQEPEANPDNKTKIIAHGFDLKTSFRKM